MALETRLKIDADTKDIQRAFKSVIKSQQEISFFQQKLNKKDPFSPKNLRDSQRALGSWSKVFESVNKTVSKNNEILDIAIQRRQKLIQLNDRFGRSAARDAQIDRMNQVISVRRGAKSLGQAANKTQAGSQAMEGAMMGALEKAGPEGALAALAIQAAEKVQDYITDIFFKGFANAKAMRDFSLMTRPGELGGVDKYGKPYGYRNMGTTAVGKARDFWNNRDLGALGYTDEAIINRRGELAGGIGVAATAGLAANTLRLNKMGIGEDLVQRAGLGVQAGQAGNISSGQLNSVLEKTFGSGVALNFNTGRMREYFNSILSMQQSMQQTAVNTSYDSAFKSMNALNVMGKQSGNSFLMGDRGGAFAQQMASHLFTPGGGAAGELMQMQAFGFKGDLADYYRTLSTGLTPDKLVAIHKMAAKGPYQAMAAAQVWGQGPQSFAQFEAFGKAPLNEKRMMMDKNYAGSIKREMLERLDQTAEGRTAAALEGIKNDISKLLTTAVEYLFTIADIVVRFANGPLGIGTGHHDLPTNPLNIAGTMKKSNDSVTKGIVVGSPNGNKPFTVQPGTLFRVGDVGNL